MLFRSKVTKDLDQGIHLVFRADCAKFEESESRMHRKNHDATQQYEQYIRARFDIFHPAPLDLIEVESFLAVARAPLYAPVWCDRKDIY